MGSYKQRQTNPEYITHDTVVSSILHTSRKIAQTDVPILITGATGSGKTKLAQYIHDQSSRKKAPFLQINCAAIPDALIEPELFGYKRGAFTGAHQDTAGKFEAAENGTILLDEIGEIPNHLQAKLLKVVDQKEYYPVGCNTPMKMKARIIAATNTDIVEAVKQKKFRQDLYYRLNTFEIHLPSLKERAEDIGLLFGYFIGQYAEKKNIAIPKISAAVTEILEQYDWPGNIRELQNLVEVLMLENPLFIDIDSLPDTMFNTEKGLIIKAAEKKKSLEDVKKEYAKYVYALNGFNKSQAAKILQVDIKTVRRFLN